MKGDIRCVEGRLWRHDPQHDDPDLETNVGACDGCDDCMPAEGDFACPTCKGSGTVNPLTAPADFFCAGTTDCPHCDGTGEI